MFDIAIVGAGPAGLSAAINARKRERSVVLIGQSGGWLLRAHSILNYPGFADISGAELLSLMRAQASGLGAELRPGVVHQILPMGESFALGLGADFVEARRVILATGAKQPRLLPGEAELLGRGVSYCGTCDGMLYRGKRIAVVGEGPEALGETNFLAGLAAEVLFFGEAPEGLDPSVRVMRQKPEAVVGEGVATALRAGGEAHPVDGIFFFRETTALTQLLPGVEMEGHFIRVDRQMRTSVPGVYAAGDCTGAPLQVAKAVGEGCIAALHAAGTIPAQKETP